MSKGQDSKKNAKKKPLLTAKEKKAAKATKKSNPNVFGHQVKYRMAIEVFGGLCSISKRNAKIIQRHTVNFFLYNTQG